MSSAFPSIERPAFFEGQRLTAADLTEAADYSRILRELHNRALHGWGVVSGLGVTGARGDRSVHVDPGLALDCTGRELLLPAASDVAVPPVALESTWFLVVSGVDDADLASEERAGSCGTEGAVRLLDVPLVRWLAANGGDGQRVRPGRDVVLAAVTVAGCKLADDADPTAREELAREQSYVSAGQTSPAATPWRAWPETGAAAGVMTTVSTATGGFLTIPSYQARLAGQRVHAGAVVDGHAHIEAASASSFDFCVASPSLLAAQTATLDSPVLVAQALKWHVVWLGMETA